MLPRIETQKIFMTTLEMTRTSRLNDCGFLFLIVLLSWFSGMKGKEIVTLDLIEVYTTRKWFKTKPTVYFRCKGENKTVLPDVKKTGVLYTFKGQESWQPLTELDGAKCKRCGVYEEGTIKSENVLDEWEFCPSDFTSEKHVRFKEKRFNATFRCPRCVQFSTAGFRGKSDSDNEMKQQQLKIELPLVVVIILSVSASSLVLVGAFFGHKFWRKRKRLRDQARFMKLFDEQDEIEDELRLDNVI